MAEWSTVAITYGRLAHPQQSPQPARPAKAGTQGQCLGFDFPT